MAGEPNAEILLHDIKLSTVVPASITGDDKNHHLSGMDLALKLHYITTVHFFGGDAAEGLGIHDFKKPMFEWLRFYYPICGRIRRQDGGGGRPYVKCNDSGVRIVEATCTKTVAEWIATVDGGDHHRLLVYHQPLLAHDFGFTPLVILQLTKFKCGGVCVGMRWAHILGDAFSALECINMWGKIMGNQTLPPQLLTTAPSMHDHPLNDNPSPCQSVKQLESLGDNWIAPCNSKMQMHTFHVTEKWLSNLLSGEKNKTYEVDPFDVISAIIWKSMAKLNGTKIVTICIKKHYDHSIKLGNRHHVIGTVEATQTINITDVDPLEIAKLISEKFTDETSAIEEQMEEGNGNLDLLVYGSNLTFVNLEEMNLYELQITGRRPIFANCSIGGVVGEGAIVVVSDSSGGGRMVNVILPEDQLQYLKNELRVEWSIF